MAQIPTIEDYTGGWLRGIQVGSNIGAQIAENRREQARMQRLMEQTQFANQIVERDQRLQEASAAREAELFRQQIDFARRVQETPVPGPSDPLWGAMSPTEQSGAIERRNRELLQFAPQDQLGRVLQADVSESGRQERTQAQIDQRTYELGQRLKSAEDKTAAMERQRELDRQSREKVAGDKTKKVKLTIPTESGGTKIMFVDPDKVDEVMASEEPPSFPLNSPAAIWESLIVAKESGDAKEGAIKGGRYVEGAEEGGFLGTGIGADPQPIDALLKRYSPQVTEAQKAVARKRAKGSAITQEEVVEEETTMEVVQEPVAGTQPTVVVRRIRVISPDGKSTGTVPEDKLEEALKRGYKRAD